MNLNEWLQDVEGRVIGDGQCVALAQDYTNRVCGGVFLNTDYGPKPGYAINIYAGYGQNGVEKAFSKQGPLAVALPGWLAVWDVGPQTPQTHIDVVTEDFAAGLRGMTQNPGAAHYMTISKMGLAGYLVPRNMGVSTGNAQLVDNPTNNGGNPIDQLSGFVNTVTTIQRFFQTPGIWQRIGIYALGSIILLAALIFILKDQLGDTVKDVLK